MVKNFCGFEKIQVGLRNFRGGGSREILGGVGMD